MYFVGDLHGELHGLKSLLKQNPRETVVQVGDLGVGFVHQDLLKFPDNFVFIRGNHDDPAKCRLMPGYLGDFGYHEKKKMFWMGGAASIDRNQRIEGVDWWADEELSTSQMNDAFDLYCKTKPEIVVTHDCPLPLYKDFFRITNFFVSTATPTALAAMLAQHTPKIWLFGHHHKRVDRVVNNVRFCCLGIGSTFRLTT